MNYEIRNLKAQADAYEPAVVEHAGGLPIPQTLSWHSGVVLTDLDPCLEGDLFARVCPCCHRAVIWKRYRCDRNRFLFPQ
jgi:hypothetical protein